MMRWDDDLEREIRRGPARAREGERVLGSLRLGGFRVVFYRPRKVRTGEGEGERPRVALRGLSACEKGRRGDAEERRRDLDRLLEAVGSPEELLRRADAALAGEGL